MTPALQAATVVSPVALDDASPTRPVPRWRRIMQDYLDGRELLWQLLRRELRVRYHQAILGAAWAVAMPAFFVGAAVLLRPALAGGGHATTGALDTAVRAVLWAGFAAAVANGAASLVANATLVGKVAFVREMLPLAAVAAAGVDMAVGLALVTAWRWVALGHVPLAAWWLVPLAAATLLLAAALALVLSAAQLFWRDVKFFVQAALTAGVFVTPVLFGPAELGPAGRWMQWNPLTPLLEGARRSLIAGQPLITAEAADVAWRPAALAWVLLGIVIAFGVASWVFDRAEDRFAERL